ncbi:MAG: translesion error-prone DNA polymerase V autoproteolytic subunit [Candidatus Kapaibacterium sp.]|jgi:DNA polymerase V|nr:translesion error-prone DNA polymerase V autoproteolytic subunit [Candidatus Kapabacteria bacterium]
MAIYKISELPKSVIEDTDSIEILKPDSLRKLNIPLFLDSVPAGFPSPADDYLESKLDLNDLLIRNPASTFFVRVTGDSMVNAGISSEDILVVDRSLEPKDGSVVIAVVDGELTVKRLSYKNGQVYLIPENDIYSQIEITEAMNFEVWGVVRAVIHDMV